MWRSRYVTDHVMWRFTLCDMSCYLTIMLCDAHIMWHHVWCNNVMKLSRYVTITSCNLTLCSCTKGSSLLHWTVTSSGENISTCLSTAQYVFIMFKTYSLWGLHPASNSQVLNLQSVIFFKGTQARDFRSGFYRYLASILKKSPNQDFRSFQNSF
jgi:hypothetical protein